MSDTTDPGVSATESDSETVISSIINPKPVSRQKSATLSEPEDESGYNTPSSEAEEPQVEQNLRTQVERTVPEHPKKIEADEWVKNFLRTNFKHGFAGGSNSDSEPVNPTDIVPLDYEVARLSQTAEARAAALSTMLSMKVRYLIEGESEELEHVEFFIIKTPPEHDETRTLSTLANVVKRELLFYTEALPNIQQWLQSQDVNLSIAVPWCHLAQINRPLLKKPIHDITHNFFNAESIIVLEDLRPLGFGKRHYVEGLSLEEAKAAIFELGRIHAITWSMQQKSNIDLNECFKGSHKPMEAAVLYDVLLQDGFSTFQEYLATEDADNSVHLYQHLTQLETKLRGILIDLFEPSPPPAPTCLTHMDFWADNLLFRVRDNDTSGRPAEATIKTKNKRRIEESSLECQIVDWQMMAVGRPTHDLALLLITSLTPEDRDSYTTVLLSYYYQTFKETAGLFGLELPFDLNCIIQEYQASKVLAVLFAIGSIELVLPEAVTRHRLIVTLYELLNENLI